MSTNFSFDNMWNALQEIRDCALVGMSSTPAGAPQRACVVPGEIVWDDCTCGLLAVSWRLMGTGSTFPVISADTSETNCSNTIMTVQVTVASLRCAAPPDDNGNAPTCEALGEGAFQMLADAVAVREQVSCCVRELHRTYMIADYAIGQQLPAGPEGACEGSTLELLLGWTRGDCCG